MSAVVEFFQRLKTFEESREALLELTENEFPFDVLQSRDAALEHIAKMESHAGSMADTLAWLRAEVGSGGTES
jgi:sugar phosphate isomerase/epimerase